MESLIRAKMLSALNTWLGCFDFILQAWGGEAMRVSKLCPEPHFETNLVLMHIGGTGQERG